MTMTDNGCNFIICFRLASGQRNLRSLSQCLNRQSSGCVDDVEEQIHGNQGAASTKKIANGLKLHGHRSEHAERLTL